MWQTFVQADAVGRSIALCLLAMSVASWVVIAWKAWLLHRARRALAVATAAFWQACNLDDAQQRLNAFDTAGLAAPLVQAVRALEAAQASSLARAGERTHQITRVLREALHSVLARLQFGQTLLASVGATAPFVGLLGTVWGVHHALMAVGLDGRFAIEQVAAPVGEALVMTAAGLAVALPAVLAYNVLGRCIAQIEADLEGFAHDLRGLLGSQEAA